MTSPMTKDGVEAAAPKEIMPPFTKKNLGSVLCGWSHDLEIAYRIAAENDSKLYRATDAYVVARVIGHGVRLALYPHRTTAGNYHLRVRDEASKDARKALAVADALDRGAGFNCTFQMKLESRSALARRAGVDSTSRFALLSPGQPEGPKS